MRKLTILVLVFSTCVAHAAKPAKITPGKAGLLNGAEYRNYTVECTNGKKMLLTSWDSGKRWCIGEASQDKCSKKQIRAAKESCKIA